MKKTTSLLFVSLLSFQVQASNWKALPETPPTPADNPTTYAKVQLGKMLFMDPRFSSTGTVSCNSCHNIMEGGDDSRAVSMGVHGKIGGRNAPTVWNSAFHSVQFWDGRAALLEDQAKGPVANPVEMGMKDVETAMARVKQIPGYKSFFEQAFGKNSMTVDNAAKAVAAFERTLVTPNSPYDKYVKGQHSAMSKQQIRGMSKFESIGCTACHSGAAFNGVALDSNSQNLGKGSYVMFPTFASPYIEQYKLNDDKGREEATGKSADRSLFRVPTLRNITDTAPYFHNGSVNDLSEAVRVMAKSQLNIKLNEKDVNDIVAFLGALTGEYPQITMPRLPTTSGKSIIAE